MPVTDDLYKFGYYKLIIKSPQNHPSVTIQKGPQLKDVRTCLTEHTLLFTELINLKNYSEL